MTISIYTSGDVVKTNESFGIWEKYLDVYGLRIFAHGSLSGLPAVDDEFIKKTAEKLEKIQFNDINQKLKGLGRTQCSNQDETFYTIDFLIIQSQSKQHYQSHHYYAS